MDLPRARNLLPDIQQLEYIIVTNDEDFYEFSVYKGFPPKIIILRTGNTSTQYLSKVLIDHKPEIIQFSASEDLGILEIYYLPLAH